MKKTRGLFCVFLYIGAVTIGGGYAMLPLIRNELVVRRRWITDEEFVRLLTLAQSAPGIMTVNLAIAVGRRIAGVPGACAGVIGAVLPSLICIMLVAQFLLPWFYLPGVHAFFAGAAPAVSGIIAAVVWTMGKRLLGGKWQVLILLGATVPLVFWPVNPILVILIGVALSFLVLSLERQA